MSNLHFKLKAQQLIDYIVKNGKERSSSWTKIQRYSGLDDPAPVIDFCVASGFIEEMGYNFYKAIVDKIPSNESDLYEFVEGGLKILLYDKRKRIDGEIFKIEMTAWSDSKIAGKWTRPDIIAVSKRKYPYVPDIEFDILTFEVKTSQTVNVLAVFEALAHRSAASLSYVVFPVPDVEFRQPNDINQRIIFECAKYGIGLICINDLFDQNSFVEILEAQRHDLDKARGSDFLRAVMPPDKIAAFA